MERSDRWTAAPSCNFGFPRHRIAGAEAPGWKATAETRCPSLFLQSALRGQEKTQISKSWSQRQLSAAQHGMKVKILTKAARACNY
ncbi:hypothetical protein LEMLEM_LOCUS13437 [Lemmus lemmus]